MIATGAFTLGASHAQYVENRVLDFDSAAATEAALLAAARQKKRASRVSRIFATASGIALRLSCSSCSDSVVNSPAGNIRKIGAITVNAIR